MTLNEEIDEMQAEDFNPIFYNLCGLKGCREILKGLLDPAPREPPGLKFWLEGSNMAQGVEQADGKSKAAKSGRCYHWWLKKWKARQERRAAKKNPQCNSGYGKYKGYET